MIFKVQQLPRTRQVGVENPQEHQNTMFRNETDGFVFPVRVHKTDVPSIFPFFQQV